ncbi:unnamed protein product [Pararhodospirillum photometricum DSM 122]|uniref:Uncharacterized protein n=1 Tax=Pararhodospirillum photometricum DSM 122 TaxID=1150469 RepID=H6SQ21_PARPM|nr:unnamed protein product [Pararhodospirillum photometricum DSM 122]
MMEWLEKFIVLVASHADSCITYRKRQGDPSPFFFDTFYRDSDLHFSLLGKFNSIIYKIN